jgi:uncharacterized membrane protein YoaK (UPF0700 family)
MVNRANLSLPLLLSFNGGYVDTAGYLALQGLFTAHVTGNFVTIGAALAFGTAGVVNKLLALPIFCAVIIATRLAFTSRAASAKPVLPSVLNLKLALLIIGAVLAVTLGPFKEADGWAAIVTGMTFVSAMAIQNAAHRIHMPGAPPTTLMTGTTTQIMIDLADMIRGLSPEAREAAHARVKRMSLTVASFAAGAAAAAILFNIVGTWCFVLAPVVAALARISVPPAPPGVPNGATSQTRS